MYYNEARPRERSGRGRFFPIGPKSFFIPGCVQGAIRVFALKKNAKLISQKLSRRSELRQFWGKTNGKSFRGVTFITYLASPILEEYIHHLSSLSDTTYTSKYTSRKNPGLFQPLISASSAQHTGSTRMVHQHRRYIIIDHTSQSTSKTGSYNHS